MQSEITSDTQLKLLSKQIRSVGQPCVHLCDVMVTAKMADAEDTPS